MYVSGLGKVDNRICIVLEWTPEEASLLQDRPSLLQLSREQDSDTSMRLVLVSESTVVLST